MMRYLTQCFHEGLKFKSIEGIRCVLNKYVVRNVRDEQNIKQLMRGIFNKRPPMKKYAARWDPNRLLLFLRDMDITKFPSLMHKLSCLFMLLAGTRVNTLTHIKITHMYLAFDFSEVTFTFDENLKHSRIGFNTGPITYKAFPQDIRLCPVHTLRLYLDNRPPTNVEQLFIITISPYTPAHPDTIARWIKTCMGRAGIDIRKYQAHSCRSASTSSALSLGLSLDTILKSAGWASRSTFERHYNLGEDTEASLGDVLLLNNHKQYGHKL